MPRVIPQVHWDGKRATPKRSASGRVGQLSQFMYGEQGALGVASQRVSATPWMDAKYYAATQTMDEARHVAFRCCDNRSLRASCPTFGGSGCLPLG